MESGRDRQSERLVWWAPMDQPWKVLSFTANHIPLVRPTDKELYPLKRIYYPQLPKGGGTPNPWEPHREGAGSVRRQRESEKPLLYFS